MTGFPSGLFLAAGVAICAIAPSPPVLAGPTTGDPLEYSVKPRGVNPGAEPVTPAAPTARDRAPTGNPLWAVPLTALTVTRDRPLFSPSRRPPPPAAIGAAPPPPPAPVAVKAAEPERLPLALIGTVVNTAESIGVFLDQVSNNVVRIRTNQGYSGWILRSLERREAIFEKNDRSVTVALPVPAVLGQGQGAQTATPTQGSGTWLDGDGQMISPPPGKK